MVKAPESTSTVSLGTVYDINKNLVEKYEKELTEEQIKDKIILVENFITSVNNKYYMLLCNDRRDFTILHSDNFNANSIANTLIECIQNRGKIYSIENTNINDAIEIWINIDKEVFCYYFFPYDSAIVEC